MEMNDVRSAVEELNMEKVSVLHFYYLSQQFLICCVKSSSEFLKIFLKDHFKDHIRTNHFFLVQHGKTEQVSEQRLN